MGISGKANLLIILLKKVVSHHANQFSILYASFGNNQKSVNFGRAKLKTKLVCRNVNKSQIGMASETQIQLKVRSKSMREPENHATKPFEVLLTLLKTKQSFSAAWFPKVRLLNVAQHQRVSLSNSRTSQGEPIYCFLKTTRSSSSHKTANRNF